MKNKIITLAVITLFLGLAVSSSITAIGKDRIRVQRDVLKDKMLSIPILEYKTDGTSKTTVVSISREIAKELRDRIRQTNTPEEKFLLFQQYGLIPKDVTLEQLRAEMYSVAERYGITLDKLIKLKEGFERITNERKKTAVNFFAFNEGTGHVVFNLLLGLLSYIIVYINYFIWRPPVYPPMSGVPSINLVTAIGTLFAHFESTSNFISFRTSPSPQIITVVLLGFVGYIFSFPFFSDDWYLLGFSVATLLRAASIEYFEP